MAQEQPSKSIIIRQRWDMSHFVAYKDTVLYRMNTEAMDKVLILMKKTRTMGSITTMFQRSDWGTKGGKITSKYVGGKGP